MSFKIDILHTDILHYKILPSIFLMDSCENISSMCDSLTAVLHSSVDIFSVQMKRFLKFSGNVTVLSVR